MHSAHLNGSTRSRCSNGVHGILEKMSAKRASAATRWFFAFSKSNDKMAGRRTGGAEGGIFGTGGMTADSVVEAGPIFGLVVRAFLEGALGGSGSSAPRLARAARLGVGVEGAGVAGVEVLRLAERVVGIVSCTGKSGLVVCCHDTCNWRNADERMRIHCLQLDRTQRREMRLRSSCRRESTPHKRPRFPPFRLGSHMMSRLNGLPVTVVRVCTSTTSAQNVVDARPARPNRQSVQDRCEACADASSVQPIQLRSAPCSLLMILYSLCRVWDGSHVERTLHLCPYFVKGTRF